MPADYPAYLECYGDSWLQHPDGLYDGLVYPGEDEPLVCLERKGMLGHSSVRQGESRYFLRFPEACPWTIEQLPDEGCWRKGTP
jgi:hypothetical protein